MKSREEFKNSVYRKLDLYYIDRDKKRRRIINTIAPVCVCLVLIFSVLVYHNTTKPPSTDSVNQIILLDSVIVTDSEADGINSERIYLVPEKMSAIVDTLKKLDLSVKVDSTDESESSLSISINYRDGKTVTYYFKEDLVRKDDGDWFVASAQEVSDLLNLINSTETDK